MKKRIGNDLHFTWRMYRKSGDIRTLEDFTGKEVTVQLLSPLRREVEIEDVTVAEGVVTFIFRGKAQKVLGEYVAVLYENKGEDEMVAVDVVRAVTLVPHSYMEQDGDDGDVVEVSSVEIESELTAGGGGGGGSAVQSDWAQNDPTMADYIKNKPDLEDYVKTESDTEQTIDSDITVNGIIASYDKYTRSGTSNSSYKIETSRTQGDITFTETEYLNGEASTCRAVSMYGYRNGQSPGSGITVESSFVLSASNLLPYATIQLRDDVYLRKRNNDGSYTAHYLSRKQDVLTAGNNISIENNVISADVPAVSIPVETVAEGVSGITAEVGTYYRCLGTVGTLAVTLPVPETQTEAELVTVGLTTGASPSVVIGSSATVSYADGYEINSNTEYEISALWNGAKWNITAVKIV